MKKLTFFTSLLLMIASTSLLMGQKLSEGTITMTIKDIKVSNPEMQQMVSAMQGTTQEIQFNPMRQKVTTDMMSGLVKIRTYQDVGDQSSINYMDMMGQKFKTTMSPTDVENAKKEAAKVMGDSKIVYDKSDTKEILGRKCFKGTYQAAMGGQEIKMVFYLTDEISVPKGFVQNMNHLDIQGCPLEIMLDMGMMSMTYVATDISNNLAADFFEKPEGDYQEMSMEQLQQMGMGGQLGF